MPVTSATIGSISTDSGSSSTDFITNDTTLTFGGRYTTSGSGNLFLWIDGALAGTITVSNNQTNATWSFVYGTTLSAGSHTVVVNTSNSSVSTGVQATQAVVIDTTAPAGPSITSVTDDVGSITGTLSSGARTDDSNLTVKVSLTGTNAVAGDQVQLFNSTTAQGTAYTLTATDITNGFANVATGALSNGTTYALNAKVIDIAGNASTASSSFSVTVDTAAPSVSGAVTGSATEDGASSTLDALAAATPTGGETLSVTGVPGTLPAGVTYDALTHSFTLDPSNAAYQHLANGATTTVTVDYKVSDSASETAASVSWTVTGTDDAPSVSGAVTGSATDGGAVSTLDALANATAVDDGDTLSVTGVPAILPDGVTYDALTHSFSLDPFNAAYQHLALGDSTTVTVDYTVSDGTSTTPASVSWTVSSADDAPTVTGAVTGSATEDGAVSTLDALANAAAVDDGETLSVTDVPAILPAGVTYDALTHSFTLDPSNAAYQHLADGATTTVTVDYKVSDGLLSTDASVSWTVTGTDDAPSVSGAVTGLAVDHGPTSTLDALANATAVDDGDTLSVTGVPAILPDGVTYDALTHSFTLDPSNVAYQHLAPGDSTTVTVDYTVSDGTSDTPASVSWTVEGADDAPFVSAAVTGSATEDGAASTLDALANAAAVDDGDTLSVTDVPAILPDGVTYDALTHSFTLDPSNAAYAYLSLDETTTVTVDYTVSDGTLSTPASVSWTVTGVLDGTVAANDLNALDLSHGDAIDASLVTAVTGTLAEVSTAFSSPGITGLGGAAVALSDTTMAALDLRTLDSLTTGVIDASSATLLTGDQLDLVAVLSSAGISGLGNEDVNVTRTTTYAGRLSELDLLTTGVVNASAVTSLLGSISALKTAYAASGITGLGDELVTPLDTTAAATDLNALNAATTGTVDMRSVLTVTGALADLAVTYSAAGFAGRGNEAITLSDATVAAASLNSVDGKTTGVVNASSATLVTGTLADVAAVYASAGISGLGDEAVTLSGTTMSAAALNALDLPTSGLINASSATSVSGTIADLLAAYASTGITGLGNEAATLSDTIAAATDLNTLNAETTGAVNMTSVLTVTGALADLAVTYSATGFSGRGDEAITLADTTLAAASLNSLDAKTTGVIDVSSATLVTGILADVAAAYASAGISGLGNEAVTLSGATASSATLNALDLQTSGLIDASAATSVGGTMANLLAVYASTGITGLGNEFVTLTDATATAVDLNTLNAATTDTVQMGAVLVVTGSLADLAVTYSESGFRGRGNEAVTLSNTTADAASLNSLDSKTTGVIDAASVTLLTGDVAGIAKATASAGISGLGNAAYDVTGTTSANTIVGTVHDDRLNGLTGNDTLTGGNGGDTFVFSTALNSTSNVDSITDFNVAQGDVIELASTVFAGLHTEPGGQLSADAFAVDAATGAGPQIVYNSATHALSYDANGVAAGGATQFATLTAPTGTIDEHAFFVV